MTEHADEERFSGPSSYAPSRGAVLRVQSRRKEVIPIETNRNCGRATDRGGRSEIYQPWRQSWSHVIVPPQIKLCVLPSEQLQNPRVSEGLPVHPGSGLTTQPQVPPGHLSFGRQRRPVEQSTGR